MTSNQIRLTVFVATFALAVAELAWTTPYETTGVLDSGAIDGEKVAVALSEGPRIVATVAYGGPLKAGDPVHVVVRRRLIGTNIYSVTGRDDVSLRSHSF